MHLTVVKTGEACIERWSSRIVHDSITFLLLGTTGSGKSSFIEALAGDDHQLGLSGATLESVTRDVQAFKVTNVHAEWSDGVVWPIYVVDTPGFSDNKISELEVVNKVEEWRQRPGTRGGGQRVMKIVNSLGGDPTRLTVVTTMWDTISKAGAFQRAENHFTHLRDIIWVDKIKKGARIVKFENTKDSALDVLGALNGDLYDFGGSFGLHYTRPLAALVYAELMERTRNALREKDEIVDDLIQAIAGENHELRSMLMTSLEDTDIRLFEYMNQLIAFDALADGFDVKPRYMMYRFLLGSVLAYQRIGQAIEACMPSTPSNAVCGDNLQADHLNANTNLRRAYDKLLDFGPAPSGFDTFIPSVIQFETDSLRDHSNDVRFNDNSTRDTGAILEGVAQRAVVHTTQVLPGQVFFDHTGDVGVVSAVFPGVSHGRFGGFRRVMSFIRQVVQRALRRR
ncbi:hypothetical protein CVT24_010167 [Panaeolus cyanescens]|uniref:G domain-containing protein n=1 Tax=Panaeolus cyanescens TaxID=181874 RepID=A0A409YW23_9AGAR|nr:hypothetical protein CVT24_010167 [Panaeolus cyanescens]